MGTICTIFYRTILRHTNNIAFVNIQTDRFPKIDRHTSIGMLPKDLIFTGMHAIQQRLRIDIRIQSTSLGTIIIMSRYVFSLLTIMDVSRKIVGDRQRLLTRPSVPEIEVVFCGVLSPLGGAVDGSLSEAGLEPTPHAAQDLIRIRPTGCCR